MNRKSNYRSANFDVSYRTSWQIAREGMTFSFSQNTFPDSLVAREQSGFGKSIELKVVRGEKPRGTSDAIYVTDQYVESVTSLYIIKIRVFDNDYGSNLYASKPRFNPPPDALQLGLIQEQTGSDGIENLDVPSLKCSHPLCVKLHKFSTHAESCNHSFKKPSLEEKVANILKVEISNMYCSTSKTWHLRNSDLSDTEDEFEYNTIDQNSNDISLLEPGYSRKSSKTMLQFSSSLEHFMREKFKEGQRDRAKKAHDM